MQSFSTYANVEEATRAYDLGIILLYGTHKRLNNLLTTYYASGKLLARIRIPPAVAGSVAQHIESLQVMDEEMGNNAGVQMMQRICGYFEDVTQLPTQFQSYPQVVAANQHMSGIKSGNSPCRETCC